jgi:hypothetical protein
MSAEIAAVVVLAYLAFTLDRIVKALKAIETEMGTARWERRKRMSDGQADTD